MMARPRPVYVVATLDTKFGEARFVADAIEACGVPALLVDVGTLAPPGGEADIDRAAVAGHHPDGAPTVLTHTDRGSAVTAMSLALRGFLVDAVAAGRCAGVIGLGGTGGTSMIARAMQALPVGFPKLMVSTVASGDTSSYIGTSDIIMVNSVVDVAGLNRVSRQVFRNAAAAIAGAARALPERVDDGGAAAVGVTMFGVTTPCVTAVRAMLEEDGQDVLTFHATGAGGRAMEDLVASRLLDGVLDITTTEVADEIVGGIFPCGPDRFDSILARGVPYVLSVGALDMVNFGPLDTVPERLRARRLHVHNASITLMRTSVEENVACARWIAAKLNAYPDAGFALLIPEGGVSELDRPGNPFHDPEADAALFATLEASVAQGPNRTITRHPLHINDAAFAQAVVDAYRRLAR
ncbi:Tm-1-like ATP-binding domain-containing protein [Sphingomonas flavalba]|uniref:Tm-1-like ATP-binding domain-containing protein n=1 Tax=Sphingomonas flavalba TaxID=2559804 RepID=UPI0039E15666